MTATDCAQLDDLAPALALGALDVREAAFAHAHLGSCGRPHARLREAVTTAAAVGAALPDEERPTPALRARLLHAARAEIYPRPRSGTASDARGRRWRAVAVGTGTLAMAASLALSVQLAERSSLDARLASTDARIAALETELGRAEAWIERAVARGAEAHFMEGEGDATAASFMLVVEDGAAGAVLLMSGLPALPEGQTYELWVEQDGAIVGVSTFRSDAGGLAAVTIDASLRGIRQAMITVEPAGGSAAPSVDDVVMQGELSL